MFLSISQNLTAFLLHLEHDIDGPFLKYLNSVERISTIIPKFKLQIRFLEERERLFSTNSTSRELTDSSMKITTAAAAAATTTKTKTTTITQLFQNSMTSDQCDNDAYPDTSFDDVRGSNEDVETSRGERNNSEGVGTYFGDQRTSDTNTCVSFPDQYRIPSVPNSLKQDIEDEKLKRFGPHGANRQILIDAINFDLIKTYKLLYVIIQNKCCSSVQLFLV